MLLKTEDRKEFAFFQIFCKDCVIRADDVCQECRLNAGCHWNNPELIGDDIGPALEDDDRYMKEYDYEEVV